MKLMTITLKGENRHLESLISIIWRNDNLEIIELKKLEDKALTKEKTPNQVTRFANNPKVVWTIDKAGRTVIEPIKTLANLKITKEELLKKQWKKASLEYSTKLAMKRYTKS